MNEFIKLTNMIKIGIIGGGFVGQATFLLNCKDINCIIYDIDSSKCVPESTTFNDLKDCHVIFICVPTPMNSDRTCYTKIVEDVINKLKLSFCTPELPHIVVRSTVPVGFSEENGVHFMPEFLTEGNWKEDFYTCSHWIIGSNKNIANYKDFEKLMWDMFLTAVKRENDVVQSSHVEFVSPSEAEMIKYTRNTFLATKVGFFNEIYNFCETKKLNYKKVARMVSYDSRIGISHTVVPGPDGKFGFGGTCLPKDLNSLEQQFHKENVECPILSHVRFRNEEIDRPDMDWLNDKGRASI